jgi:hemoglobin
MAESVYEEVGEQFFMDLVTRFYEGVADDPVLRPLYPDEDLGPAVERLRLFLVQYWGGPTTYSDERGHPRLRMRHAGFKVDDAARVAWIRSMLRALTATVEAHGTSSEVERAMREYFETAAGHMVNHPFRFTG